MRPCAGLLGCVSVSRVSPSMQRLVLPAILTVIAFNAASAGPLDLNPSATPARGAPAFARTFRQPPLEPAPVRQPTPQGPSFGGGFLEMLFGGNAAPFDRFGDSPAQPAMNPRFIKQVVSYDGKEKSGTILINTNDRLLYLVQEDGRAIRYGIGVGRPGFTWAGVHHISRMREWPDWTPPPEMLKRRPDLPRHMEGGPENPLGARAMYLGSSLYRIHGSNEPWTIGQAVSSGCIRMRNEDVIDLYGKVKVGAKVVVI